MRKYFELERELAPYEHSDDNIILPGMLIVTRLDGKNFHSLKLERPFDNDFIEVMQSTVEHLIRADFKIICAYSQSDEISLLFHPRDDTFNRKVRKINSVLAGYASAFFTKIYIERNGKVPSESGIGIFDCRTLQFPSIEKVLKYFSYRFEDAKRNFINMLAYNILENQLKMTPSDAHKFLMPMNRKERLSFLTKHKVNFKDYHNHARNGTLFFKNYEIEVSAISAYDNLSGKMMRRKIKEAIYDADSSFR